MYCGSYCYLIDCLIQTLILCAMTKDLDVMPRIIFFFSSCTSFFTNFSFYQIPRPNFIGMHHQHTIATEFQLIFLQLAIKPTNHKILISKLFTAPKKPASSPLKPHFIAPLLPLTTHNNPSIRLFPLFPNPNLSNPKHSTVLHQMKEYSHPQMVPEIVEKTKAKII